MVAETLTAPSATGEETDEFLALETKITRVAEALQLARTERDRAQAALGPLQAAHEKLQRAHAEAEHELVVLRKERHEVRSRVAKLMRQLETADA